MIILVSCVNPWNHPKNSQASTYVRAALYAAGFGGEPQLGEAVAGAFAAGGTGAAAGEDGSPTPLSPLRSTTERRGPTFEVLRTRFIIILKGANVCGNTGRVSSLLTSAKC